MLLVVKTVPRRSDSSVGKELAVPSRGPEFHPQDPDEEAVICANNPLWWGAEAGRSSRLAGQLTLPDW